ncbi:lipopolysaccharide biosynthesis protein [Orbus mooreae]|uniref:lipopolysaccharide biosynthesis protein n=1 Tax=Orbus mooreae TaxID=3074107 RepID=UPI00370D8EFE
MSESSRNIMKNISTKVRLSDSLISMIGVVVGQLLFFISLWFIGRYLGADVLGELNYQLSLATFLGTIFVFRYELACICNSSLESFKSLCNIYFLAIVVVSILSAIALIFDNSIILIVLFAFSFIVIQGFINYLNSLRKYVYIGFFRCIINLFFTIAVVILFLLDASSNLFLIYSILYSCVAIFLLILVFYEKYQEKTVLDFSFFLQENRRYPLFIFPSTCCSAIYLYALSIFIPVWYGLADAGYFTVAYKMGFFPIALLSQSISGVFRRDMLSALDVSSSDIRDVYKTYMKYMLILAILYGIFSYLFSEWIIEFMFGQSWSLASTIYKYMIPLFFLQLLYSPASQLFLVFKKQKIDFLMNFLFGSALGILFLINYIIHFSLINLIILFTAVSSIVLILNLCITYRMVFNYDRIYN